MEIKVDTTNLKVLGDFFQELSTKDQSNIWMSAYKKAAQPLIKAAQGNIKNNRSFGLYRSIGIVPYKDTLSVWIGSKKSTPTVIHGKLSKVWYARLVEWDHRVRGKKRGQPGTGIVPGTHFFEKAVISTAQSVFDSLGNEWTKAMDRYMVGLDRKLKKFS
jgi:hypothetical protein